MHNSSFFFFFFPWLYMYSVGYRILIEFESVVARWSFMRNVLHLSFILCMASSCNANSLGSMECCLYKGTWPQQCPQARPRCTCTCMYLCILYVRTTCYVHVYVAERVLHVTWLGLVSHHGVVVQIPRNWTSHLDFLPDLAIVIVILLTAYVRPAIH